MLSPRKSNKFSIYRPILIGLVLLLIVASHLVVTGEETVIIEPWQARVIYAGEVGLSTPSGLAYSPSSQTLLVATASPSYLEITGLTLLEDLASTTRVSSNAAGPFNVAFDSTSGRLYTLDGLKGELVSLGTAYGGYLNGPQAERVSVSHYGLKGPAGMAFDPNSGDLFILDSNPQRIVRVQPQVSLAMAGPVALQRGQLSQVGLQVFGSTELRGIALDPVTGHLFLLSAAEQMLYEMTRDGEVIAAYDLSQFDLRDPQGMVFAHTGDNTDDPGKYSLYIADGAEGGHASYQGKIVEIMLEPTPQLPANTIVASLVNTIDTSAFSPPSPDPAGITYYNPTGNLLISDSEVNEITPTLPNGYKGANIFESVLGGGLVFTATTVGNSNEPTGTTINPGTGLIYFSDDDADEIYILNPGSGNYNDGDETWSSFDTRGFGATDAEGVAYGNGNLFIVDGVGREVYVTDLNGNLLSQFDVAQISTGLQNPEGIEYDPSSGTLFIVDRTDVVIETTTTGTLLQVIDISAAPTVNPGGVALGPPSGGGGGMNLYVADRGIDNNVDPNENDGKVFELSVSWPLPPVLTFNTAKFSQAEGASALITVNLIRPPGGTVEVDYATSDGTALVGLDYSAAAGTLTFSGASPPPQTFLVTLLEDVLDEAPETVNLTLSNPTGGAVLGSTATAVLNIIDNDPSPSVQLGNSAYAVLESAGTANIPVSLSATSGTTVTVDYATSDITALAGPDYTTITGTLTFTPGVTNQTLNVPIVSDAFDEEDNETFSLALSNPISATAGTPFAATITIQDDDPTPTVGLSNSAYSVNENGGNATMTVTLSAPSGRVVTVNYFTSDITATAGSDYTAASGMLTFAVSETVKTIVVPISEDALDEFDETFGLTLNTPVNAVLGTSSATITIVDNDALPNVLFSASDFPVTESAGNAVITVFLNPASGRTVTVDYATSDNTATAGSDYTTASGTLTFLAGETSKTFSVPILDDAIDEGTETANLTLSNLVNASPGAPVNSTMSIIDDDGPPTLRFSNSSYSVAENGGSATITVTLIPASGLPVTVDYATSDGTATAGTDYVATSGTLTFLAGETSKSFTVGIIDNAVDEADKTVNLALSNENNAILGTPNMATLTIVDDDGSPTVGFSSATYTVAEDGGPATITVNLSNVSGQAATVDYATSDGTGVAGTDYLATSGTLSFAAGETSKSFTISIIDDSRFRGDRTVNLTLSNANNATLGLSSAVLTITEDDPAMLYLPLIRLP